MFSPSDYNDAVPQFTNGNYANTPQNPLYVEEPDADNYNRGAEPLQTLPAQWWNWLCNKITAKLNNLNIYVKNIFNELAALLSLVNVTPDATEEDVTTEQLKDMFATKYPQYIQDNFKTEPLLHGRTRGVMVAPTDTWNDNTHTLSLTGGFGIINTYNKVTFSDCDLVIPNYENVHFIVSDTSGVISIQSSIKDNVILIGLCKQKEYCLLIDNNPDQCKDNIILKKWFGQNNISQNFVPFLQTYYNTTIASIETEIYIETVNSNGSGISNGALNNCTITIETVSDSGTGIGGGTYNNCTINIKKESGDTIINDGTFDNCTINIKTVNSNGKGVYMSTLYNCTITIKTVSDYGEGIFSGTLNNCTITIETVSNSNGKGIYEGTLDNCTITIKTVSGYGVSNGTLNNCTITIETVNNGGAGVVDVTLNNCTITIEAVNGDGVYGDTFDNCTITIKTVISGGTGISIGIYNNCTITIKTVRGYGIFSGTYNNCTITFETVSSSGKGVDSGTLNNCTITIETVNGGIVITNDSVVVLYLTKIKCYGISSLSNTGGKLNILNDTVFHSN